MDFTLNEEQRDFQQTLRRFVDREIVPVAAEWERTGRYPTEIVDHLKALGLFGLTTPEEYGGLALDMVSFTLVYEEISRGWMGIAGILGSHGLSAWMIAKHGTQEQKDHYLPKLATGEWRTGSASPSPAPAPTCRASPPGPCATATTTSSTAPRPGSPTPGTPTSCPSWSRPTPTRSPAPRHVAAAGPHRHPGFEVSRDLGKLGYKGTESCEINLVDVRVPVDAVLGGVEGRGMQQALSGWRSAGSTSPAGRSVSRRPPTTRR